MERIFQLGKEVEKGGQTFHPAGDDSTRKTSKFLDALDWRIQTISLQLYQLFPFTIISFRLLQERKGIRGRFLLLNSLRPRKICSENTTSRKRSFPLLQRVPTIKSRRAPVEGGHGILLLKFPPPPPTFALRSEGNSNFLPSWLTLCLLAVTWGQVSGVCLLGSLTPPWSQKKGKEVHWYSPERSTEFWYLCFSQCGCVCVWLFWQHRVSVSTSSIQKGNSSILSGEKARFRPPAWNGALVIAFHVQHFCTLGG